MCGVVAVWAIGQNSPLARDPSAVAESMANSLKHRGPDANGLWSEPDHGLALAHTRLSIIDVSDAGAQPMQSDGGRYVISFNGELYNFREIRKVLDQNNSPPNWHGRSDSEVLVNAIERWGIQKTLQQAIGMFAFAVWDRQEKVLTLARDRLGEKPLYYGYNRGALLVASELSAILHCPQLKLELDRNAVAAFMRYAYVPAPLSILKGFYKLEAGTSLNIRHPEELLKALPTTRYWSLHEEIEKRSHLTPPNSRDQTLDELDRVLRESLRGQMISDVPLGAFLSGGIDSSTITAIMQSESDRPIDTFTIGFRDTGYDEAARAAKIAKSIGTSHHELYLNPKDALDVIPDLGRIYSEPFADASQIPTYLLARFARSRVKVALSGDGGDELFGGYNRHWLVPQVRSINRFLPSCIRRRIASRLLSIEMSTWERASKRLSRLGLRLGDPSLTSNRVQKFAPLIALDTTQDLYTKLVSHWDRESFLMPDSTEAVCLLDQPLRWPELDNCSERLMALDTLTYLPDDILVKVDRAAMAVSLEVRVPFLDPRVVAFAWRLPLSMKIRKRQGKKILRELLSRYLPGELMNQGKSGFGFPVERWLRGSLRDWAEELINPARLKEEGILNPDPVSNAWHEHMQDRGNHAYALWNVLMFQAWYQENKKYLHGH